MFEKIKPFLIKNYRKVEKVMKFFLILTFIFLTADSFLFHSLASFIKEFISLIILLIFIFLSYNHTKIKIKKREKILQRYLILDIIIIILSIYLIILYSVFFIFYPNNYTKMNSNYIEIYNQTNNLNSLEEILKNDLIAYTSYNKNTYEQPINAIIISDKNIAELMQKMGWEKVETFSQDKITFLDFIAGIIKNNLPMTDSYFLNTPQNLAFQKNSRLYKRDHVRYWIFPNLQTKENIILASFTEDTEFALKNHHGFWIPSHGIEPDTDKIRDKFKEEILKQFPDTTIKIFNIGEKNKKNYFTDGKIIIMKI